MNTPSSLQAARRVACAGLLLVASTVLAGPWQNLYNGRDLTGWRVIESGGRAPYQAVGEAIVGTTISNTPNSFLATDRTYGDFILEL